jgi:Flp pilus assembly protein TadD
MMKLVIEKDPDHAEALNYLGYTYADRNMNLDEALELIERALEIKPESGYIVDSLGWVYYQRGEYRKAIRELERAVTLTPDDPVINEHLGDGYLKLDQKTKALDSYKRALELDPQGDQLKKLEEKIETLEAEEKESI